MAKKKKDDDKQDEMSDGSVPVNDAWTGMLAISLIALVVATGFLGYDYFVMSGETPKAYNPMKPGPPPKIVIPKAEEKDKDKDKDKDKVEEKDKDKDKDKDKEKDMEKEKDKAASFAPTLELALIRQLEIRHIWLQRPHQVVVAETRRLHS
jgi:hypothetical protein